MIQFRGPVLRAAVQGISAIAFVGLLNAQTSGTVLQLNTLPDLALGAFQNTYLPGSITNDRGFLLGGIGSGLWHSRQHDADGVYWMLTDRGPNPMIGPTRTFPVQAFTPFILKVQATGGALNILEAFPLRTLSMNGATGLPNLAGTAPLGDENNFDVQVSATGTCVPTSALPRNQNGLDTEGIIRMTDGTFWLVEEYSTSILKVDASGTVVKRFVPAGVSLPSANYPTSQALPAAFRLRTRNRGFEGIALSPDDKTVFATLQSPLQTTGNNFFNTRILAFNTKKEDPSGEWVYKFDDINVFTAGSGNVETTQSLMKISGVAAIDEHNLLILERTDFVAKVYRVDTRQATDILGGNFDSAGASPTLESISDLAAAGITALPKQLVINLESIPGMPDKIEGLAILDKNTIAVANDNDFAIGTYDSSCNSINSSTKSHLVVIRLEQPLW